MSIAILANTNASAGLVINEHTKVFLKHMGLYIDHVWAVLVSKGAVLIARNVYSSQSAPLWLLTACLQLPGKGLHKRTCRPGTANFPQCHTFMLLELFVAVK